MRLFNISAVVAINDNKLPVASHNNHLSIHALGPRKRGRLQSCVCRKIYRRSWEKIVREDSQNLGLTCITHRHLEKPQSWRLCRLSFRFYMRSDELSITAYLHPKVKLNRQHWCTETPCIVALKLRVFQPLPTNERGISILRGTAWRGYGMYRNCLASLGWLRSNGKNRVDVWEM